MTAVTRPFRRLLGRSTPDPVPVADAAPVAPAEQPGVAVEIGVTPCHEAGAYVIEGEGSVGTEAGATTGDLVVFANAGGALKFANPGTQPLDVMVLGGATAEGPLVFHGPFVMNSIEQARAADIAFRTGRMGTLAHTP